MNTDINSFISHIKGYDLMLTTQKIRVFGYYLTEVKKTEYFNIIDMKRCFNELDETVPKNLYQIVINLKCQGQLIPTKEGFKLERKVKKEIGKYLEKSPIEKEIDTSLVKLREKLRTEIEKIFYDEILNCLSVDANRSAVVMTWNLCIAHMQEHILSNKLVLFNKQLLKEGWNQKKKLQIHNKDAFLDMREQEFIDCMRNSGIITKDIKKILDQKLGIRNTYAHPNDIKITNSKVSDFLQDLVENVIGRY